MELNEAVETLINGDIINEALECVRNNESKAALILTKRLKYAINNLEKQQEIKPDHELIGILNMII